MVSKSVTMKDIAEYTGFSIATISRVINGNYPVNVKTKEKVLNAIEELNYEPNLVAKNLRSKKSNLVAIIVADITNPYYVSIAKEIDDYLFKEGYNLITCSTGESTRKEDKIIRSLLSKQVDAIALSPSDSEKTNVAGLINENVPVVLVDRKLKNVDFPFVGTNNFIEGYQLTEYLIKKGHKNIGIITGKLNTSTGQDRFKGFERAMKDYNLDIKKKWVFTGEFEEKQAYKNITSFLENDNCIPTAIVSSNNLMAKGLMDAFKEKNIRIPEDVSLVSFGVIENSKFFNTQITSIEQDTRYIGKKVAEILLSMLNNKPKTDSVIVKSNIIEGNSVKTIY